ncbi:hypothetical protein [Mesobacillus harenae]|uniref:hypothetical protein n=1 Tax=Mesobacillus harenae TaxID=2213203 RepID=UPI001580EEE7|nr:hypothetical protein [Mesobacillus harenae]
MYYYNNSHALQGWSQEGENLRNVQSVCNKYMNYHVLAQMRDGSQMEGIIQNADEDGVIMLVPEVVEEDESRQYGGYGGYGVPGGGYGVPGGYGGGRRRYRRYRRRRFPYVQFVFPFILPFPFY